MFYNMTWLERILWLKRIKGGSYIIKTLTGEEAPITISDAIKSRIKSLVQYGKCEQASTPTPSAPVDIKCNNGKLGIISDGVPIEYIRLEYLQSSGTQYIDTGVAIG